MQRHNSRGTACADAEGRRAVRAIVATLVLGFAPPALASAPAGVDQGSDLAYRRAVAPAAAARKLNADAETAARVRALLNRLVPTAALVEPSARSYAWAVNVLSDPAATLYAYPGGRLIVHDALAKAPGFVDEELAAIIAHAIAHSLLGHDARRIEARLANAPPSADPNKAALAAAEAIEASRGARFSREEVAAADRTMVELMARAALDPRAAGSAWRRARSHRALVERFPVDDERLAAIDTAAREAVPLYDEARARAAAQAPMARPPSGGSGRGAPR